MQNHLFPRRRWSHDQSNATHSTALVRGISGSLRNRRHGHPVRLPLPAGLGPDYGLRVLQWQRHAGDEATVSGDKVLRAGVVGNSQRGRARMSRIVAE